jgi:ribosomal protein S2
MSGPRNTYRGGRGAYRVLVRRPEGRRSFGRPKRGWYMTLKYIRKKEGGGVSWIDLAQEMEKLRVLVERVMKIIFRTLRTILTS